MHLRVRLAIAPRHVYLQTAQEGEAAPAAVTLEHGRVGLIN